MTTHKVEVTTINGGGKFTIDGEQYTITKKRSPGDISFKIVIQKGDNVPRSTRCWSDWRKLSSAANRPDFNSLKPFFDAKNGDIVEIDITELKSWYKVMLREDAYMYGGEFVKQMRHLFPEHLDRIEQIDDDFQCVDFQHTGGAADDSLRGFSSTANFYTCINDQGIIVHTIDGYVKRVKFPDGVELSVD